MDQREELKKALKLEKHKQQAIGEIVSNLVEVVVIKDMEDIREYVSNKVFEERESELIK